MVDAGVSGIPDIADARRVAARLAARTEIRGVRMLKSCARIVRLPVDDPYLAYDFEADAVVEYEPGDASFVVRGTYKVAIRAVNPDDQSEDSSSTSAAVANIEFEQAALFVIDLANDEPPPETAELDAYAISTGQFALHPYVREYVSDITGRLGLPPLTLGVLAAPMKTPADDSEK
jgi:hypothetical protein